MAKDSRTPLHIGMARRRESPAGSTGHRLAISGGGRPPPPPSDSNAILRRLGMQLREMYAPFLREPMPDHLAELIKRLP